MDHQAHDAWNSVAKDNPVLQADSTTADSTPCHLGHSLVKPVGGEHGSGLETKRLAVTGRSSTGKATASNARRCTPPFFFPQSPSMPWGRDTGGICRSAAARPLLNTTSRLARGALSELVNSRQGRGLELEEVIDGCFARPRRLGPPRLLYPCLAL